MKPSFLFVLSLTLAALPSFACAPAEQPEEEADEGALEMGAAKLDATKDMAGAWEAPNALLVISPADKARLQATLKIDYYDHNTDGRGTKATSGYLDAMPYSDKVSFKTLEGCTYEVEVQDDDKLGRRSKVVLRSACNAQGGWAFTRRTPTMLEGSYDCLDRNYNKSTVDIVQSTATGARMTVTEADGKKLPITLRAPLPGYSLEGETMSDELDNKAKQKTIHRVWVTRANEVEWETETGFGAGRDSTCKKRSK